MDQVELLIFLEFPGFSCKRSFYVSHCFINLLNCLNIKSKKKKISKI